MNTGWAGLDLIESSLFNKAGVALYLLRLDTLLPHSVGNKYFKLKYNIQYALKNGYGSVLSFGGAYSNHIHALALAGAEKGIRTLGFIRGEKDEVLNDTLRDAVDAGMELHYLSRQQYRGRNNPEFLSSLQARFPDSYIIPEGGSNTFGVKGCMEIVSHIDRCLVDYDVIALPCGTSATLAGVVAATAVGKTVIGFSVLKNAGYLEDECEKFISKVQCGEHGCWAIFHQYHCGGYAKFTPELVSFIDDFYADHNIVLEPVYSGKMLMGLYKLLQEGCSILKPGMKVVAIHTGGLQGLRGMKRRLDRVRVAS